MDPKRRDKLLKILERENKRKARATCRLPVLKKIESIQVQDVVKKIEKKEEQLIKVKQPSPIDQLADALEAEKHLVEQFEQDKIDQERRRLEMQQERLKEQMFAKKQRKVDEKLEGLAEAENMKWEILHAELYEQEQNMTAKMHQMFLKQQQIEQVESNTLNGQSKREYERFMASVLTKPPNEAIKVFQSQKNEILNKCMTSGQLKSVKKELKRVWNDLQSRLRAEQQEQDRLNQKKIEAKKIRDLQQQQIYQRQEEKEKRFEQDLEIMFQSEKEKAKMDRKVYQEREKRKMQAKIHQETLKEQMKRRILIRPRATHKAAQNYLVRSPWWIDESEKETETAAALHFFKARPSTSSYQPPTRYRRKQIRWYD